MQNQKDQLPNYHVIARRAKPDVAISLTMVPVGRIYREIATGLTALAMTWLF